MSKHQPYGNVKMKGKREKLLPCTCCVAINKKKLPRATQEDMDKLEKQSRIYKPNKQYAEIANDDK